MKIVIAGSSGLIGSALVRVLQSEGDGQAHQVLRLVRRAVAADDEVSWDPDAARGPDPAGLAGVDAAINLAGVGLGDHRWTDDYKQQIVESRVVSTELLSQALAQLEPRPRVLLSGSAVGYYGDTGDNAVDESAPAGTDFLANVAAKWEAATGAATDAGIRTVLLRTGIVLSSKGGALGKVLPMFRLGVGGRLGSGKQYLSWIARPDYISAVRFLLDADDVSGAVNMTAPNPVTNREYTKSLADAVHRPALFPAPTPALRLAIGEFAGSVVGGQRVLPKRLLDDGFEFAYPEVGLALRALIEANA
jgi:uncharacterized protein (TIGR01777 family)